MGFKRFAAIALCLAAGLHVALGNVATGQVLATCAVAWAVLAVADREVR